MLPGRSPRVLLDVRGIRAAVAAGAVVVGLISLSPATAYQRPGVRAQVDLTSSGHEPASGELGTTSISGDGRYVAFDTDASDLVPGDNNNAADVFVRDTVTNKLELISRGVNGLPGVGVSTCTPGGICYGSPTRFLANGLPNPDVGSWDPSISRDGRYVAFTSTDANLIAGVHNPGFANIYVYDRRSRRMAVASVSSTGVAANGHSFLPSISASGRYVSFTSDASNLVTGDTNGIADVFVRDIWGGKTTRVSVGNGNAQACLSVSCQSSLLAPVAALVNESYPESSISGDGRYVEFSDDACNLVSSDTDCTGGVPDVFVHDSKLGTTVRISVDPNGREAMFPPTDNAILGAVGFVGSTLVGPNNPEYFATGQTISDDGRFAVFVSTALNLVPNNPSWDPSNPVLSGLGIYVRDLRAGRTYRVDVQSDGQPVHGHAANANYDETDMYPSISADGRYVAMFCSNCVQLKPISNLQVYDRITGETQAIPCPADGARAGSSAKWNCDWAPAISADGRHVSFTTYWTPTTLPANFVGASDAFTFNRGGTVTTGGLAAAGKLSVRGSASFARSGVVTAVGALTTPIDAADLLDATMAYRPAEQDLFVREDVRRLPAVAGTPLTTGVSYGFDLVASGRRYEVRTESTSRSSFGLFRETGGAWVRVADVSGGFGTTGDQLVFTVPLADLGLQRGGALSDLRAFTSVGTPTDGETTLDAITLPR